MIYIFKEGLNELIPNNSYIFDPEYKLYRDELSKLSKEYLELKDKLKTIPKSAEKPMEEWSSLEKFMHDEFGDVPRYPDSDDLKELKANIDKSFNMMDDLKNKISRYEKRIIDKRNMERANVNLPKPTNKKDFEGFTSTTTGTSYYDDFLNPKELEYLNKYKNLNGYVAELTPFEYLEYCADIFNSTFEKQILATDEEQIKKYSKMMKSGTKFYMPYLNFADKQQEGRHRAQAAILANIKTIPVLIVY